MRPTKRTEFLQLKLMGYSPFILGCCIVSLLTLGAGQRNYISHFTGPDSTSPVRMYCPMKAKMQVSILLLFADYSKIWLITPAPTVRPPSRIAKRRPSSMAIGVINSPMICTLSPGITISTPSSSVHTPVTSVVRK